MPFGIGLFEWLIILVVSLAVLGPQRLSQTVRTVAHLWGRFQRWMARIQHQMRETLHQVDIQETQFPVKNGSEATKEQDTLPRGPV